MKTKFSTYKTANAFKRGVFVWLFIFVLASPSFSQGIFIKAEIIPHARENRFTSTDEIGQSAAQKLYALYGNDFEGLSDFYLSFNLQERQTVRYEVVDITGRPISSGEIPDVLDQTYKVGVQVQSTGIYIVRLLIDSRYYSEKVYFK